jgi:Angiotensin-converting enzyme
MNFSGNMWAQSWSSIAPLVMPYPRVSMPDVTKALVEQVGKAVSLLKVTVHFRLYLLHVGLFITAIFTSTLII